MIFMQKVDYQAFSEKSEERLNSANWARLCMWIKKETAAVKCQNGKSKFI